MVYAPKERGQRPYRKEKHKKKCLKVYYNNINGYQSKEQSFLKIIKETSPDIIALCETKRGQMKETSRDDVIPGYKTLENNVKRGKEGLMVALKKGSFKTFREVTDKESKNIFTVRVEYPNITVRIIILHAPQETDKVEERSEFFEEVTEQIERCHTSEEVPIVLGDFNARTEYKEGKVAADSSNGKMLLEMVENFRMKIANYHPLTSGQWTRIQKRKDGSIKRSMLDYVLLQQELYETIGEMIVDEEKIHCPYRETKSKAGKQITFSDHCAIIIKLEINVGTLQNKANKVKVWNITEEGLLRYSAESERELDVNLHGSSTEVYTNWSYQFDQLLQQCFTKKTIREGANALPRFKANKKVREILSTVAREGRIQRKVVKLYLTKLIEKETQKMAAIRALRMKSTTAQLTEKDKFSPNGYWKVKKAASKTKKGSSDCTSVVKMDGTRTSEEAGVIEAYKEEFEFRLRNRKPDPEWEEYVEETNCGIRNWLKGPSESSPPFTLDEVLEVRNKLKEDKSAGYDRHTPTLFTRAGSGMMNSLMKLFNTFKKNRETPEQWNMMKIVVIYKNKGSKSMLKNYRGIFLALIISKMFEGLIKKRIEENLKKINILQAGSRQNRGTPDNVFLLRCCVDHYVSNNRPLYITAYDYEQAFDSLWVEDCIVSLRDLGVSKEMLQLIYSMNKKASVVVKTPYGPTSVFTTDPIVKQGTVLGSILCSSSTGEYCGLNEGVDVGTMMLGSLLYVDDIIDLARSGEECIRYHLNALLFSLRKKLGLSGTKCYNMVVNENEDNRPIELEIDDQKRVKIAEVITYLGDLFNKKGNNDDLIRDRVNKGIKAMISISSIMEETDVGVHKVSVYLLLYQSLFLSTVLFNSCTWSKLRKKDIDALKSVQLKFLKKVVGVAKSTCNAFTYLELGVLPIEQEIHKRQLMFLHRIIQLEETDPVLKMFYNIVKFDAEGEKNWWTDVKASMDLYIGKDLNQIKTMSKEEFRILVKKSVETVAFSSLVQECTAKKKTADLTYDKLETQEYLRTLYPNQARIMFKCRSKTLDIKTHSTYKYEDQICRKCGVHDETLGHVINCKHTEEINLEYSGDFTSNMDQTVRCLRRIDSFLDEVK